MARFLLEFPPLYVEAEDIDEAVDNAWHMMNDLSTSVYKLTEVENDG